MQLESAQSETRAEKLPSAEQLRMLMDTGASSHWGADPLHANMAQVRPFNTPAMMHMSLQRCSRGWDLRDTLPPGAQHVKPGYMNLAKRRGLSACRRCQSL